MRQRKLVFFLILLLGLQGCAPQSARAPTKLAEKAEQFAKAEGFEKSEIQTKTFLLTTYQKTHSVVAANSKAATKTTPNSPLKNNSVVIYIEGDGRSWISRSKLSPNPTPRNPLALKLAALEARHSAAQVVYLARPCQYTSLDADAACTPEVWSSARFSESVIQSMNEAVQKIKEKTHAKKIHLVGYSGGAAIAVLIAARRKDVATLRTVAGDLDHETLSKYHQTTPLQGSLNPKSVTAKILQLPQQHFTGMDDTVVPPFIAQNFVATIERQGGRCAESVVLKGVSHHKGWEAEWINFLNMPFKCYNPLRSRDS